MSCWDTNANGACEGSEDVDASGICDAQDCQGQPAEVVNALCGLYQLSGFPAPSSLITEPSETTCDDGRDNDCDGLPDLSDSDCQLTAEICTDGIDNDGNTLVDCIDPACTLTAECGCSADDFEPNETFIAAHSLGTLTDSPASSVAVTGNIAPEDDRDWYRFFAMDVAEGDTVEDSFAVRVNLVSNPGGQFMIRVYRDDPVTGLCGGEFGSTCNDIHYFGPPGDAFDTRNDSVQYWVEVVRDPSIPNDCASYTFTVSNGL